ncbi:MAG: phage tail tape measure protein, partial [Methanobrevibacter sp.]|nr:phage tail tape measure protein [Methanobrevibacter sp.]
MAYQEDVNVNLNILAGAMGGVTAIMGSMSALTSTFSQMGTEAAAAFGSVDAILVGATAMITAFGAEAANAFGEYEQGMKIVQAVSGQSSAAIAELGNQANQLSVAYRTSIDDITEGLQTLGRAGLSSANEQIEVLESGLQTAKLEGRNLNGVLEEIIQNTAMLGGDLKSINFGEQADYLNSLMVGTSMTAPIDSHDISQTLQYAGGTAAAAGANLDDKAKLEDLMGTIAAFAQKGVSGSMAGTALRAFFTKPASQDNSVTEGLGMIGLSPYQLWENGG